MNKKYIWAGVIVAVLLVLWVLSRTKNTPMPATKQVSPVAISLNEVDKSGQSGTAVLKEINGKATVVITLNGQPKDVEEPAHIHIGSCQTLGDQKYALNPVKNGSSETILEVPLSEVLAGLPLALNVHKSEKEMAKYVACGDIVLEAAPEDTTPTTK